MKKILILLATCSLTYFTSPLSAQNLPDYLPADGLVGWWPFNGNANDESGNWNNGTVNGATLIEDRFGNANNAFDFDGIDDWMEIQSSSTLDNICLASFNFWIKTNQTTNAQLLKKGNFDDLASAEQISCQINIANGNQSGFSTKYNSSCIPGMGWLNNFNSLQINNNNWQMVTGVIKHDSTLYFINGELINAVSTPNSTMDLCNGGDINLGRNWSQDIDQYDGVIDDLGFWNRPLNQQEISNLFHTTYSILEEDNSTNTSVLNQGISYQAIARNAEGTPLAEAIIQVQFTLLADSLNGNVEYTETHALSTNNLGLFTTAFGRGTALIGTFSDINWTSGNKFLNVQIDTGNGLINVGTSQLLSVPFAQHSATSGAVKNTGLPIFSDNAAALAGGLAAGEMYRTSTGVLMVVY